MPEITRAMSFHSKNIRFRHYFKLVSSLLRFLWNFIALNVAIDYFIKEKSKI